MIKKNMLVAVLTIIFAGCASEPKNEDFKVGIADCARECKSNPEVKEYSQKHGGGFMLLFFGGEEIKCSCNR